MTQMIKSWILVGLLLGTAAYAVAEDVTLTTYLPSPRGMYNELRTIGNTYLAVQTGNVGVGTANPTAKLEVATDAATTGLVIKGAVGQTADLLQLQDSTSSLIFGVNSLGLQMQGNGIKADSLLRLEHVQNILTTLFNPPPFFDPNTTDPAKLLSGSLVYDEATNRPFYFQGGASPDWKPLGGGSNTIWKEDGLGNAYTGIAGNSDVVPGSIFIGTNQMSPSPSTLYVSDNIKSPNSIAIRAAGFNNMAIYGEAYLYGVTGVSTSPVGQGVWGGNSSGGAGVRGDSTGGVGVYGYSNKTALKGEGGEVGLEAHGSQTGIRAVGPLAGDFYGLVRIYGSNYLQLGTTTTIPQPPDCQGGTNAGLMIFDTTNNKLYICHSNGTWVAH